MEKIEIELKGNVYKFPLTLNDVEYTKGLQLMSLFKMEDGDIKYRKVVSCTLECPISDLKDIECEEWYKLIYKVCNTPVGDLFNVINIGDKWFTLTNPDDINTEEYIDIDYVFKMSKNILEIGVQLMAITYKPVSNTFENLPKGLKIGNGIAYNVDIKPIYTDDKVASNTFEGINSAIPAIFASVMIEYKISQAKKYSTIFGDPKGEDEEDKPVEFGAPKETVASRWGVFDLLQSVCDGKRTEMEAWYKTPVDEFLTHVCYTIEKNKEIIRNSKNK